MELTKNELENIEVALEVLCTNMESVIDKAIRQEKPDAQKIDSAINKHKEITFLLIKVRSEIKKIGEGN